MEATPSALPSSRAVILPNHSTSQWDKIWPILNEISKNGVTNTKSLVEAITTLMELAGHIKYARSERLRALSRYIEALPLERKLALFSKTFPFIAQIALTIVTHYPKGYLLACTSNYPSLTLSRESVAAILANMFYCTIPVQSDIELAEYIFHGIMCDDAMFHQGCANGKLDCIFTYFDSIAVESLTDNIKIVRNVLSPQECEISSWIACKSLMKPININKEGKIEDTPENLMVDFANEFVGGGIDATCVQEQILFVIHPELFVGCLACERMKDNEAVIISGVHRYSLYKGYDETFEFMGKYEKDHTPRKIIAIDALYLDNLEKKPQQFSPELTLRELNKAYAGFMPGSLSECEKVSTGKWGSGTFNGNVQYKLLIQWVAASRAGREVDFFSFGDELVDKVKEIKTKIEGKKTVGEMMSILLKVGEMVNENWKPDTDPGVPFKILRTLMTS